MLSQRRGQGRQVDDYSNNNNNNSNNNNEEDVFIAEDEPHKWSSTAIKVSKGTNTSTEDLEEPCKIDKSTSTADLFSFNDSDQEGGSVSNSSPESDAFKWTEQSPGETYRGSPNLTDSTKVQNLQKLFQSVESQSSCKLRKFSSTAPLVVQSYLGVNELHRASSSPNLFGE